MNRLDRHDYILMARRKRRRAVDNRPRPWLWAGQSIGAIVLTALLAFLIVIAIGAATTYGIYTSYAAQLPDASVIEEQQDEFETVRIYDRTGEYLLYESIDPRPFRGDRRYVSLQEMSPWAYQASVALEDRNFWENPGINARGLLRLCLQFAGGGPRRFFHHPTAHQKYYHCPRRACATELCPQDQRSDSGA
ncbi:MAG: transglycosylase domain-containing protein [Caldilineaceae bacterium]